ncbi:unnamed protein product [Protopolystoma xenopodis]|uniref:Uncharacterized protein n=1 Tax=Protopolystoma xenopodis TaxID=117903 RepID=A0A3S5FFC1_9PLAT|nr:unnamed protein product [Protopolystoma xenopodis]
MFLGMKAGGEDATSEREQPSEQTQCDQSVALRRLVNQKEAGGLSRLADVKSRLQQVCEMRKKQRIKSALSY